MNLSFFQAVFFIFFYIVCPVSVAISQTADISYEEKDTVKVRLHSPHKAAIYSAILPGAGQVYNKKYWKVPLIYTAFGTGIYFIQYNYKNYIHYREAYKARVDEDPLTIDQYVGLYTDENLKYLRDFYRRNFELSCIVTGAIYILNIIDASVDAHLFYFQVDDDVSLRISSSFLSFLPEKNVFLKVTVNF